MTGGVTGHVTIQRGCDKFCTFCVVPYTRGRERGTPPREVLRQARAMAAAGYHEVQLLGQTVNSYRYEDVGFGDLLRAVATVDGIERIRFTSPYPLDFSDDVIAAMAETPKICKHVHLPLQSASDAVLARMKRGYDFATYRRLVDALRAAMPRIAITTDLMVGFSDETEDDFAETLRAQEELRFDTAFMFAYSEREGTFAARKMPDTVPEAVKSRRLAEIIALQQRITARDPRRAGRPPRARPRRARLEALGRRVPRAHRRVPRRDRPGGPRRRARRVRRRHDHARDDGDAVRHAGDVADFVNDVVGRPPPAWRSTGCSALARRLP